MAMLRQKHNGSIAEMGEQIDTLNKVRSVNTNLSKRALNFVAFNATAFKPSLTCVKIYLLERLLGLYTSFITLEDLKE